jgi:hypothetical protein
MSIGIFIYVQYSISDNRIQFLVHERILWFPPDVYKIWDCKGAKRRLEVATTDGASMCVLCSASGQFSFLRARYESDR